MRKVLASLALAAASLLAACMFESETPLIPPADYATPLSPGDYSMLDRKDDGSFAKETDLTLVLDGGAYTMRAPDGEMRFVLYRISPNVFLAQFSDKPVDNVYALLEPTPDGAAITHLACAQLNAEERTRFHLTAASNASCVFKSLDDVVAAAMYMKGRGETPGAKLARR